MTQPQPSGTTPGLLLARLRRAVTSLITYHGLPGAILVVATLVLFRTWLGRGFPGGTDSGFLYSGLAFYRTHGLGLFTVWLSEPFGQVSQYSVYWLLSMIVTVFRGMLFTYKLMAVLIALLSALGMYAVSWSWSRSRLGALAAALVYSFSPLSISQWLTGHLDVQISIALGPLALWCIVRILDHGSLRAAVGLGLCGAALLLLTTGQAAYWLPAVAVVVAGKFLTAGRGVLGMLRRTVPAALAAIVIFLAASAVQLLPWLSGARAAFAGGQNLAIETLAEHAKYSLPFAQGVLGVARETWLPSATNLSFTSFGSLLYIVPQAIVVVAALLSVLTRRGTFAAVLLPLAVAGWFLAAGPFGPIAGPYAFIWQHVVYFRELRVPNRWLMVSLFSVASMLALSVGAVTSRLSGPAGQGAVQHGSEPAGGRRLRTVRLPRLPGGPAQTLLHSVSLAAVALVLLTVNAGTIFARGLPTISPPAAYTAAYRALAQVPGDWRVLTVPFGQSWMGAPVYGDYEGIAADLGIASTFYDGRSVVANGGWDPNASQFATFLSDVVNQGADRHLAPLLGAAGIRYIVVNPELPVQAPWNQAAFLASQEGLRRISRSQGVTVYQNQFAQSQITQATSACVIAGGYTVLEDLTEDPSFSFKTTAVYFADQVVSAGGWQALARLVARSHCLITGPGAAGELTVLHDAEASVQATSIAPASWLSGTIHPLLDSQASAADWLIIPPGGRLTWNAPVTAAGRYSVWVRILRQPGAVQVPVSVNGAAAGSIEPGLPATVGYQWLHAGVVQLHGGHARIVLTGLSGGTSPQIAEIALVQASGTTALPGGFQRSWLVEDHTAADASLYSQPSVAWSRPETTGRWQVTSSVQEVQGPHGSVTLTPVNVNRQHFSLTHAPMPAAINPAEPLAFRFQGPGNGATFSLSFLFRNGYQKSFSFVNPTSGPQTLFITPQSGDLADIPSSLAAQAPFQALSSGKGVPDWRRLERVTLSTSAETWPGGKVQVAGPYPLRLPHALPYFTGHLPAAALAPASGAQLATPMVAASAQVRGLRPGILDFSQSYDPHWQLTGQQASLHTVELGFENSFLVDKPASQAALTYSVAAAGETGTLFSLAVWCLALLSLLFWPFLPRLWRRLPPRLARRRSAPGLSALAPAQAQAQVRDSFQEEGGPPTGPLSTPTAAGPHQ